MTEDWDFYFANTPEGIASIFLNLALGEDAPHPERTWLLRTQVAFPAREDGLPEADEAERLEVLENDLCHELQTSLDAPMVGRVTLNGHRAFFFYASEFAGFEEAVARAMASHADYPFACQAEQDADWQQYLDLYPSAEHLQCMMNRRVVQSLSEHGDVLTKPRPVSHWAYFADEASRSQFDVTVSAKGFTVIDRSHSEEDADEQPFGIQIARDDPVDWNSINQVTLELFELADANNGRYDGWETGIERGEPGA